MANESAAPVAVPCRYAAFISYRHVEADRAWAVWLHHALEAYRVPKLLVAAGRPARVGRVFRDEEELEASANLSEAIECALRESHFLIVVCSRSTPGSRWVNAEIQRFRALGRGDRVLTLLTDGEPETAFPPALQEIRVDGFDSLEPLAADVRANRADGMRALRQRAKLRLIAPIIGCRFDDLRQRDQERRVRQMLVVGMLLMVLSVILSAATVIAYRASEEAQAERDRATQRLADLYGRNALSLLKAEDLPGALLWFAAAVDAAPRAALRWRTLFSETRRRTPSLVDAIALPTAIEGFDVSAVTQHIAVGGRDCALRISGKSGSVTVRACDRGWVNDARFDARGSRLVTAASDGTARVWDASTGEPVSVPLRVGGIVHWAALVDDEDTVVTINSYSDQPDWNLRVWKANGEAAADALKLGPGVESVAFDNSRPNRFLAAIGDNTGRVRVFDIRRGLLTTAAQQHQGPVGAVVFDRSGRYVASASEDGTARVWDVGSGRAVTPPLRHDDEVTSIAFDALSQRVVTGSWDRSARVWSIAGGHALSAAMRSNDGVLAVSFDPSGTRIATGAFAGTVRVWDAATGDPMTPVLQLDDDANSVSFFDSNRLVTQSRRLVSVWHLDQANPRALLLEHHTAEIKDAELSPDGRRIATASADTTARVWDARTGAPVTPEMRHVAPVLNVTFSNDGGRLLTTDDAGNVRAWDAVTGAPLGPWLRHSEWAEYARFAGHSGMTVVVAGGDDAVHVWDYVSGRERVQPIRQDGAITGMTTSADGAVAVSTLAKSIRTWSIETGSALSVRQHLDSVGIRMAFSADGSRLATVDTGGTVQVWDRSLAAVGKPIETRAAVYAMTLSPDGRKLLTVGRDTAREWDVDRGISIGTYVQSNGSMFDAVFSGDGRYVATIERTGPIRVWNASSAEQLTPAYQLTGSVYQRALDSSGIQLVGVRELGRPLASGVVPLEVTVDETLAARLQAVAEALAGRRVAAAGFLETLSPEEIAKRVEQTRRDETTRPAPSKP